LTGEKNKNILSFWQIFQKKIKNYNKIIEKIEKYVSLYRYKIKKIQDLMIKNMMYLSGSKNLRFQIRVKTFSFFSSIRD
jgi:hypothetical protein